MKCDKTLGIQFLKFASYLLFPYSSVTHWELASFIPLQITMARGIG